MDSAAIDLILNQRGGCPEIYPDRQDLYFNSLNRFLPYSLMKGLVKVVVEREEHDRYDSPEYEIRLVDTSGRYDWTSVFFGKTDSNYFHRVEPGDYEVQIYGQTSYANQFHRWRNPSSMFFFFPSMISIGTRYSNCLAHKDFPVPPWLLPTSLSTPSIPMMAFMLE